MYFWLAPLEPWGWFLAIFVFDANSFSRVGWLPWSLSLKVSCSLFSRSDLRPLVDLLIEAWDSPISPSSSEQSDSCSSSSTSTIFPLELSANAISIAGTPLPACSIPFPKPLGVPLEGGVDF